MAKAQDSREVKTPEAGVPTMRVVGVIELGTTSIRMAIAEIDSGGKYRTLETLQRAVALGKDTFTTGTVGRETTEQCVDVLKSFNLKLQEYRITDDHDIMAVATSAVREASNRDTFLDRLFIATGINVRPLDEAEVNRFTYQAVHFLLQTEPALREFDTIVAEVGGGSTEVLVFRKSQVASAHTYRLGSLRLREMLDDARTPDVRVVRLIRSQVERSIEQVVHGLSTSGPLHVLALGGDARFAVSRLEPTARTESVVKLKVSTLSRLANETLRTAVDDLVKQHHLSYPDAETRGPALLVYAGLARALGVKTILVGKTTLRDGMLQEMAARGSWTKDFTRQVISSTLELGARYDFDREHAEQVAEISKEIFEALWDEHLLGARYELILTVAALLHETGRFVSNRSHHKHSMYVIRNSDVFGLGSKDLCLAAVVARYHRKALPKPSHEEYMVLDRSDRVAVAKLVAILRVADALSRWHGRGRKLHFTVEPGQLTIGIEKGGDLALEQHRLRQKGDMFEMVYGMQVVLRRHRGGRASGTTKAHAHQP